MSYNFLLKANDSHKKRCLVVGDIVLDSYIFGSAARISSEAPIPVIEISRKYDDLGGAGNVIKNLKSFGFDVCVVSVVGNDEVGLKVMNLLNQIGIDARIRVSSGKITSNKTRLVANGSQVARFDLETKDYEDQNFMKILKQDFISAVDDCDIVIISDYERGVLEDDFTSFVISESLKRNKKIICDPRVKDISKYSGCTIITPNLKEASNSFGSINPNDSEKLKQVLLSLKNNYKIERPVVTLSEHGIASIGEDGNVFISPAYGGNVVDVTGAGDTVVASFAFSIANNFTQEQSCIFANMAASMVIDKVGTHATSLKEIQARYFGENVYKAENFNYEKYLSKIISKEKMREIIAINHAKKFVFTNGCYDIIHTGHLDVISRAKVCGDVLILGLNSDTSVKRLKGETRPVNNQQTRASVLAALEFVDYVVVFEEDTPEELIKFLKPNILAKGIDYIANPMDLPGAKYVERVEILGVKKDSTTDIISKILKANNK